MISSSFDSSTFVSISHVTLVGLGLIGGSFAMLLRERLPHVRVCGIDAHEATLQKALQREVVHHAFRTLPTTFEGAHHLVVLASHLQVNAHYLTQLGDGRLANQPHVTITDMGSCKRAIASLGEALLPEQFIAGHPMAGRETSGLETASSLLFVGKRFLLTPSKTVAPERLEAVLGLLNQLGMRPSTLSAEEHDHTMAFISHFPQLCAILLTNLLAKHQPGKLLAFHGGGIDDQLRLAASPYAMWKDIYAENADNLRPILDEFITSIEALKHDLDQPELEQWFTTSNQINKAFHQLKQPKVQTLL